MTLSPTDVMTAILNNPTSIQNVRSLVTDDVTYVSLNYDNPDLKRVMPWAGTGLGPDAIVKTFVDVARFWSTEAFATEALFSYGENVAWFGRFTYRSKVLAKTVTSPFAIFRQGLRWQVFTHAIHGRHVRYRGVVPQRRSLDVPGRS